MSDETSGSAPAPGSEASRPRTPLDMLGVMASQEVEVTATMRHLELYTRRGLLTVLWHGDGSERGALICCGGAMGGLLGPGDGVYHRLGTTLPADGVAVLRVSYRSPNDLDMCCVDLAAAVQLAIGNGAEQVVLAGHSFGGAVAVRVGVGLADMVAGVVTYATQSAGCEVAGGLAPRPFLLFHGDRDEILPIDASAIVRDIAGTGELVVLPGDGHLLAKSSDVLIERTTSFVRAALALNGPEA